MSDPSTTSTDPGAANAVEAGAAGTNGGTPPQQIPLPADHGRQRMHYLDRPPLWPEPWAGEAFAQQAHVKARMRVAYFSQTRIPNEQRRVAASAISDLLASVRKAVTRQETDSKKLTNGDGNQPPSLRKKRPRADVWQGTSVGGRTPPARG